MHTPSFRVLLADCTGHAYNGQTVETSPVGGIPIVTVRLAEALTKAGCQVTVRNHTPAEISVNGVTWQNKASPYKGDPPDIIIASNDVKIFDEYADQIKQGAVPVLWVHNLLSWKRLYRKKRLGAMLRWRPAAVFLGTYHYGSCSPLMPLRSRHIIPHGVGANFFDHGPTDAPQSQVLFLAKAFRGFGRVVKLWQDVIHPARPDAVLKAYIGSSELEALDLKADELADSNIQVFDRAPQSVLIDEMSRSACLFYPGHKDETFCNIAAEASVVGLPIATLGIGALKERSANGRGICVESDTDLANAVIQILSEPDFQKTLSRNAILQRDAYKWDNRVSEWIDLFAKLRSSHRQ